MKNILICFPCTLLIACTHQATTTNPIKEKSVFSVIHKYPQGRIPKQQSFRTMAYYRTEVKNLTDKPIRIITFEGYHLSNGKWQGGNILGKKLDSVDFSNWYTEGDRVINGIIAPHQTAICDVNWHGSSSDKLSSSKWSYTAVDTDGKTHTIEAVVDPSVTVVVDVLKK